MYQNIHITKATAYVKMDNKSGKFKIGGGVRQGDPLSFNWFNCALEEVFRKLEWEVKGLKLAGEWLNNLHFADDAMLIVKDSKGTERNEKELAEKSEEAGLKMNMKKNKNNWELDKK